ncbi:hypothetical protein NQ317_017380 [Molorchus minor]|uniref:Uncharacterized protein n=1 Tax=Molorchus minor TaxID=1323400 RepID=A0ABQ9JBZ0_9CUCU|nr:hypothetical protein NQ317_017380 [Molorchus minor]
MKMLLVLARYYGVYRLKPVNVLQLMILKINKIYLLSLTKDIRYSGFFGDYANEFLRRSRGWQSVPSSPKNQCSSV